MKQNLKALSDSVLFPIFGIVVDLVCSPYAEYCGQRNLFEEVVAQKVRLFHAVQSNS